jgi:hypothetical protein
MFMFQMYLLAQNLNPLLMQRPHPAVLSKARFDFGYYDKASTAACSEMMSRTRFDNFILNMFFLNDFNLIIIIIEIIN